MGDALLTCQNLTVGYEGVRLCTDISFTLHTGEYMSIIGPSGIGKSALAGTILGVQKPAEGEVIYENGMQRTDIGCLPQEQVIRSSVTVREVVLEGCLHHTKKWFVGRAEKEFAMHNLERVGLADFAKRRFGDLSGGQRQRVLLARALCSAKKLLILDEPMHGLDAYAKDEIFHEIVKINESGIAVMLIDANAVDGTVLHLSDRQLFCGSVTDYIRSVPGQFYFMGRII
ncbi:MAG: ATP-binding cassette domain-containing protein [Clostridia bacterium]|nr:ATP-binding cassette domain-containing protein [Clostridia bacterium]